ncbi:hypothetical protein DOE73_13000 [Paenibacillus dendritiformis]|nr:hypothetical protein DOE73_13000 [Paenibacillus dendritiformis]
MEMDAKQEPLYQFLAAAISGNEEQARAILAANRQLPKSSIYAAAAAGEADIIQDMLMQDASLATEPGGPEQWEPLLYLSFSCLLADPQYNERFAQSAKLLLDYGANANAFIVPKDDPCQRKLSALYGAAGAAGNAAVAQVLLEAGADPNDGESLYHAAEASGHEGLELLYRYGADVNATPALFRKLDFEDVDGVQWFVDHGADLNQTLGDNGTPLHWAVVRGRSCSIVELLLNHGAPVNARRADGKTAYMLAVRYGQQELAVTLARHGAWTDVDPIDRLFGSYAAADKQAVLGMLNNEPSLLASLSDDDKMMLLEFAELDKAEAVKLMLETGFDSSIRREEGAALHIAAWHGHIGTVRALIMYGASLKLANSYGGTPLESAIHGSIHSLRTGGHAAVVEALIQAGAAVPEKAEGSRDVRQVLCRYGASA